MKEINGVNEQNFDNMLWPVVITDKNGKVLYKNDFASKIKLIRKGGNLCRLFKGNTDFIDAVSENSSRILECKAALGVSHAIVICEEERVTVFFTANTMIIRSLLGESYLESNCIACSTTEMIIDKYKNMCSKMDIAYDENANSILKYNSLRFFRASHYYEMYYLSLSKTAFSIKDELLNISDICKNIGMRFAKQISPLGYRLFIDVRSDDLHTRTKTDVFLPVLLESAAIALKISDDRKCSIVVSEFCGMIKFDYFFNSSFISEAKRLYDAELDFIKTLSENMSWRFSGISELGGGNCVMSFSIPVSIGDVTVRSENIFIGDMRTKYFEMLAASVVSALFFGE